QVCPRRDLADLLPERVGLSGGGDRGGEEIRVREQPVDAAARVDGGDERVERGGGRGVEAGHAGLAVRGEAGLAEAEEQGVEGRSLTAGCGLVDEGRGERGEPVADHVAV